MNPRKFGPMLLVLVLGVAGAYAQSTTPEPSTPVFPAAPSVPIDEIIRKFAAKEKEFAFARANYTYQQDVRVQELSADDRVLGEYHMTSEITFDQAGKRAEKVTFAPPSSLKRIGMTAEDLRDIREIQPFVLTSDEIGKYSLKYVGKENVDEIGCYAFEVEPKKIEKDQRYFQGKIWVDDRDFQIVKTYGKAVPDLRTKNGENLFPRFETYREQVDEYWFPTYTRGTDTLDFSSGKQKMRQIIRYGNYKKFQANVKLSFGDVVDDGKSGASTAPPPAPKAPALEPKYKKEVPAPKK